MRCTICKKEENEIELFEGIRAVGMIRICEPCSLTEGIPTIKKPSDRQLEKADERYSVRERMEEMSGMRKQTEASDEQINLQGKLAKLRAPPKKQTNENLVDDYAWNVTIGRRRKKLSISQLANETGVDYKIIQGIEKGRIPENYEDSFSKLEKFLRVNLIKNHTQKVSFTRNLDEEKEILKGVQERLNNPNDYEEGELENRRRHELKNRDNISEDLEDLDNVTIDSLVERNKAKEKTKMHYHPKKERIETDAMVGNEIELDLDMDEY